MNRKPKLNVTVVSPDHIQTTHIDTITDFFKSCKVITHSKEVATSYSGMQV